MINKIKGAIFDMDGTLVDSLIFWDVLWDHLGMLFRNGEKFRPTDEEDKNMRTMTLRDAMYYINSIYHMEKDEEELFNIAKNLLGDFYETKVELKNGVHEFLKHCQNRGIKMCVASASAKEYISGVLKRLGIDKYFGNIFSCEEIGKGKDKPDIYLTAMEYLGTNKEETCVFEDSLTAIMTANKIGMKTVAIYDKFNYGQKEMKEIADEYIAENETLKKLIF